MAAATPWFCAAAGWLSLALLWLVGTRLPLLAPWAVWLALLALAALPAWGLWLAHMLRKRALLLQLTQGSGLVQLLGGPWWPALKSLLAALALSAAALWQAYGLQPWEWAVLALGPLLHIGLSGWLRRRLGPQFAEPAFAWAWSQRVARWVLLGLLGGLWATLLLMRGAEGPLHPPLSPEQLDASLADIQAAHSALVRWGLDALFALQQLGHAAQDLSLHPMWRPLLLIVLGPGLMTAWLGASLQGLAGLSQPLRQASQLRRNRATPAGARAWLIGFIAVLGLSLLLTLSSALEGLARQQPSPLALQRLPACERIGGQAYQLGTIAQLRTLGLHTLRQLPPSSALCARRSDMQQALEQAVDGYLDWYFSLGAEWLRIAALLTGGPDAFLQQRLQRTLAQAPGLGDWLLEVQAHQQQLMRQSRAGLQALEATLARHRLVLDGSHCRVQQELPDWHSLSELASLQTHTAQRLGSSAALGGATGLAALVAGQAMGKTSMKAASKVLTKAAAKQAVKTSGGAALGAVAGSALPGLGTAVGAGIGLVLGAGTSVAIDWAMLRAEEQLTREGLRAELLETVMLALQEVHAVLDCPSP